MKTYIVGTHKKRLPEALLMSIHNIYFHGEVRKQNILTGVMTFSARLQNYLHNYITISA